MKILYIILSVLGPSLWLIYARLGNVKTGITGAGFSVLLYLFMTADFEEPPISFPDSKEFSIFLAMAILGYIYLLPLIRICRELIVRFVASSQRDK